MSYCVFTTPRQVCFVSFFKLCPHHRHDVIFQVYWNSCLSLPLLLLPSLPCSHVPTLLVFLLFLKTAMARVFPASGLLTKPFPRPWTLSSLTPSPVSSSPSFTKPLDRETVLEPCFQLVSFPFPFSSTYNTLRRTYSNL